MPWIWSSVGANIRPDYSIFRRWTYGDGDGEWDWEIDAGEMNNSMNNDQLNMIVNNLSLLFIENFPSNCYSLTVISIVRRDYLEKWIDPVHV